MKVKLPPTNSQSSNDKNPTLQIQNSTTSSLQVKKPPICGGKLKF